MAVELREKVAPSLLQKQKYRLDVHVDEGKRDVGAAMTPLLQSCAHPLHRYLVRILFAVFMMLSHTAAFPPDSLHRVPPCSRPRPLHLSSTPPPTTLLEQNSSQASGRAVTDDN